MEYESAFVIPDIAMALALLSAAVLRWRGHPDGPAVTAAAAGSLVMLGMLDVSFNLKNGVYATSAADLISNGLLNLYCVSFGLTLIWHASRRARVAVVHA